MKNRITLNLVLGLFVVLAFASQSCATAAEYRVLYSFQGGSDGQGPEGSLVRSSKGTLYGATQLGGSQGCYGNGCGVVFELTDDRTEKILYTFHDHKKGAQAVVSFVQNGNDTILYGTTEAGGVVCGYDNTLGCGTIFSLGPHRQETTLHRFRGRNDGAVPDGLMRDATGNVFGVAENGGPYGLGTLFKFALNGKLTVVHYFVGGTDGAGPVAPPVEDATGNLFDTTTEGGEGKNCDQRLGCGTIFEVTSAGQEKVRYVFQGGTDGEFPFDAPTIDSEGNLYGTTMGGGGNYNSCYYGCGTVYRMASDGTETILHAFQDGSDGWGPIGNLIIDTAGNLYGTASSGGTYNAGVLFKLTSSGQFIVLHAFRGSPDGEFPGRLTADAAGNIYGATGAGGNSSACSLGCGTVFRWRP